MTIKSHASYGRFGQAYRANIFGETLYFPVTMTVGTATIETSKNA